MSDHDEMQTTPEGVRIIQGPDGIRELDNPMPRWMASVFIGTILWGVGYLVFMPGLGINLLGYGQYKTYEAEMAEAKTKYAQAQGGGDLATLLAAAIKDPAAVEKGKATFSANCAACHGADGSGAIGPNLKDATWLYGGKAEEIAHTIANGTAKGMPPFQTMLSQGQLAEVAAFVHSLSQ